MSLEHRLKLIQTIVVVIGVAFAVFEVVNAVQTRHHQRYEATAAMLARFGDADLIDGVNAIVDAGAMDVTGENYNAMLARLTPTRQHFIVWSACLAEGICLAGAARQLFCERLIAYETVVESMMTRFEREYDRTERQSHYFGELEKCIEDFVT